jgi:hypothetical protein
MFADSGNLFVRLRDAQRATRTDFKGDFGSVEGALID